MGYDVLNIGETDLGLGVENLSALQKHSKVAFTSANLKEEKTGKTVFKPYLVKVANGIRIGIIGLLTSDVPPYIYQELNGFFVEDPTKAAIETVNGPLSNCDFVIALAHLNHSEIESLAQMVPQISIIIGGYNRSYAFPQLINRSIYVQTAAFGLSVGRLNLGLVDGRSEFVDTLQRTLIRKNIEEIQKKVEDPKYANESEDLKKMQDILIEQEKKLPEIVNKNSYENFSILLHPTIKSDPEIEKLVSSSKDRLK